MIDLPFKHGDYIEIAESMVPNLVKSHKEKSGIIIDAVVSYFYAVMNGDLEGQNKLMQELELHKLELEKLNELLSFRDKFYTILGLKGELEATINRLVPKKQKDSGIDGDGTESFIFEVLDHDTGE